MEKQIEWHGKSLNYYVEGQGPSVVLLHGFLENYHVWDDFMPYLISRFSVIAVDLPGFGKSAVYGEKHDMSFMAEAVKFILDQEKVTQTFLIGHSMGGYVSLAFAKLFPESLKGLVLFHSQAAADDEQGKKNRSRTIEVVKKDHKNFISQFIPLLFAESNVAVFENEIAHLREESLKTSTEGVIASLAGMRDRDDNLQLLENINVPVFFVIGKQDSRIPLPKILSQISLPKLSEAIILDEVGHMGFVEAPEKTFPAVQSFCERYS